MISNCQKYLAILLTFICIIILYPQSTYATEAISQREIIRVWASLRWTDTICRMKPENEAAMDMISLRLMARYWNVRFEYIGYDKSWGNMQKIFAPI